MVHAVTAAYRDAVRVGHWYHVAVWGTGAVIVGEGARCRPLGETNATVVLLD